MIVEGDTWERAEENAIKLGGHLVTINNKSENKWLVDQLYGANKASEIIRKRGVGSNGLWIGFNDKEKEGSWENISGENTSYSNWAPGEPDGRSNYKSGENYASFNLLKTYNRDPGIWADVHPGGNPSVKGDLGIQCGLAEIKIE